MKSIRQKLGLSQVEMAALLGISRTNLAMHETNQRPLPSKQLLVLANIEMLLQKDQKLELTAEYAKKMVQNNAVLIKDLTVQISKAEFECLKLQRRLEKFQKEYEANQKLWVVINQLKKQVIDDTAESAYLSLLEITCQEKIVDYGLDKQALLHYHIALLQQQKETALKVLDTFPASS